MWLVTWPGYRSTFPGTAEYLMYPVVAVLVASLLVSPAAAVAALVFGVLDVNKAKREEKPLLKLSGLVGILLIVGPILAVLLRWLHRILIGW